MDIWYNFLYPIYLDCMLSWLHVFLCCCIKSILEVETWNSELNIPEPLSHVAFTLKYCLKNENFFSLHLANVIWTSKPVWNCFIRFAIKLQFWKSLGFLLFICRESLVPDAVHIHLTIYNKMMFLYVRQRKTKRVQGSCRSSVTKVLKHIHVFHISYLLFKAAPLLISSKFYTWISNMARYSASKWHSFLISKELC